MTEQEKIAQYKPGVIVMEGENRIEITGPVHEQHGALFAYCEKGTVLIRWPYDEKGNTTWAKIINNNFKPRVWNG